MALTCGVPQLRAISLISELTRQVLADQAIHQRRECLASTRQYKRCLFLIPIKLEAGRECRDPDLANRRVRRNYELARRLFKQNIQHPVLFFHFKPSVVRLFTFYEVLFERVERGFGVTAKFIFVQHGLSVARQACIGCR